MDIKEHLSIENARSQNQNRRYGRSHSAQRSLSSLSSSSSHFANFNATAIDTDTDSDHNDSLIIHSENESDQDFDSSVSNLSFPDDDLHHDFFNDDNALIPRIGATHLTYQSQSSTTSSSIGSPPLLENHSQSTQQQADSPTLNFAQFSQTARDFSDHSDHEHDDNDGEDSPLNMTTTTTVPTLLLQNPVDHFPLQVHATPPVAPSLVTQQPSPSLDANHHQKHATITPNVDPPLVPPRLLAIVDKEATTMAAAETTSNGSLLPQLSPPLPTTKSKTPCNNHNNHLSNASKNSSMRQSLLGKKNLDHDTISALDSSDYSQPSDSLPFLPSSPSLILQSTAAAAASTTTTSKSTSVRVNDQKSTMTESTQPSSLPAQRKTSGVLSLAARFEQNQDNAGPLPTPSYKLRLNRPSAATTLASTGFKNSARSSVASEQDSQSPNPTISPVSKRIVIPKSFAGASEPEPPIPSPNSLRKVPSKFDRPEFSKQWTRKVVNPPTVPHTSGPLSKLKKTSPEPTPAKEIQSSTDNDTPLPAVQVSASSQGPTQPAASIDGLTKVTKSTPPENNINGEAAPPSLGKSLH